MRAIGQSIYITWRAQTTAANRMGSTGIGRARGQQRRKAPPGKHAGVRVAMATGSHAGIYIYMYRRPRHSPARSHANSSRLFIIDGGSGGLQTPDATFFAREETYARPYIYVHLLRSGLGSSRLAYIPRAGLRLGRVLIYQCDSLYTLDHVFIPSVYGLSVSLWLIERLESRGRRLLRGDKLE